MFRALGIVLTWACFVISGLGGAGLHAAQTAKEPFVPPDWVSVEADRAYGELPAQKIDVYLPARGPEGKRPGLLFFHGGGWKMGSRKSRSGFRVYLLPFLSRGFVAATADYRLSMEAAAPAAVSDALEALRWFKGEAKRLNMDPNRIVVMGESAGAHLALMTAFATKSARLGPVNSVAAVVNAYGPADVGELLSGPHLVPVAVEWVPDGPEQREMARRVSPVMYVRKGLPPVESIHGTSDPVVPYAQSVRLTRELRAKGVNAELIGIDGGGHGFEEKTWNDVIYPRVFEFLRRLGVVK